MRIVSAVVVVPSLFTLLAACSSAGPGQEPTSQSASSVDDESPQHVHWQKDAHHGGGGSGGLLVNHGGPVLSASHVYSFWWGTNQSAFPTDAKSGIAALFEGMNGSQLLSVANQYSGAGASTSYVSSYEDTTSNGPSRSPATSAIVNEACKIINANGLTADRDAIYFVYTTNFPGRANYCAWHSDGTCNGTTIQVAYMPNTTGMAGCDPGNLYNCNTYSQGTRSLANVSSHEYMEALTDPHLDAWYDGSGSEIGDKCAWQFSSCVNLTNGNWQLQKEWSNAANGCVQQ